METDYPVKVELDESENSGPDIKLEPEESNESDTGNLDPMVFDGFESELTGKFHRFEFYPSTVF